MTAPYWEDDQTDIIPALRPEIEHTAVDAFGPVADARHDRRSRFLPAAGVASIFVASVAAMYATYTLGSHAPAGPAPAPSVVSEEPAVAEPASSSPIVRPSRTQADRHRPRPTRARVTPLPSPSSTPATTAPSPSPSRTSPSPAPQTGPTTAPPASEQPDPATETPQSPTETPEVEST